MFGTFGDVCTDAKIINYPFTCKKNTQFKKVFYYKDKGDKRILNKMQKENRQGNSHRQH
jgi:hypothetical protein